MWATAGRLIGPGFFHGRRQQRAEIPVHAVEQDRRGDVVGRLGRALIGVERLMGVVFASGADKGRRGAADQRAGDRPGTSVCRWQARADRRPFQGRQGGRGLAGGFSFPGRRLGESDCPFDALDLAGGRLRGNFGQQCGHSLDAANGKGDSPPARRSCQDGFPTSSLARPLEARADSVWTVGSDMAASPAGASWSRGSTGQRPAVVAGFAFGALGTTVCRRVGSISALSIDWPS